MSEESSWVNGAFLTRLRSHCDTRDLGPVLDSEASYRCFPSRPNQVRKPDISFIKRERHPGYYSRGYIRITPDLVIEVISPNDDAEQLEAKIRDYVDANVALIWIAYPQTRTVWILRRDGTAARLREDQMLTGEDIVPGFQCRVGDFFPPPPPPDLTEAPPTA